MAEIIVDQIKNRFISLLQSSKKKIIISSQFLRMDTLDEILKSISSNIDVEVLTSTNLGDYLKGRSDIEALERLSKNNVKIRSIYNFTNKLFFFDDKVLLSSININDLPLKNKNEFGVLFSCQDEVQKFKEYYQNIIKRSYAKKIAKRDIVSLNKCYKKLNHNCNFRYDIEGDLIIQIKNIEDVSQNISAPWQQKMILFLNKHIQNNKFWLNDVYLEKTFFETLYPNNKNINARIRRTLQELRDFGLIKFYGNGHYKILWEVIDE